MKTTNRKWGGIAALALVAAVAAAPLALQAATTITIDSVVQRWPWNNKVDIIYTVDGGQDSENFQKIVFTTVINGVTHTIDDARASANTGTHTFTWTLPDGVKSTTCRMSAAIYAADAPSGDDYMVVDLDSGAVTYEGIFASQEASNARYNTATYKTDKLVLRKVPAGGPYPTGDDNDYKTTNSSRTWKTDRDYYIGVFPVTQYQYQKIYGSNPSKYQTDTEGNLAAHRPVEKVAWDDLRLSATAATSSIPAVATSGTGTFFQRLNFLTGLYFDLPTEVMFEIAQRAGATTKFYWGDTMNTDYVVSSENSGGSTVAVGSRLPNAWGLFDTAGNVWELCLDAAVDGNMADQADAFTPAWAEDNKRRSRGGGAYNHSSSLSLGYFNLSFRLPLSSAFSCSQKIEICGFRVSVIADK